LVKCLNQGLVSNTFNIINLKLV